MQKIKGLREMGYFVAVLDGAICRNVASFLSATASAFQFPNYYGDNLNAFLECINDLGWLIEINYVLVILNHEHFMLDDSLENKNYINVLIEGISKEWANVPTYPGEDEFRIKADFKVLYL